MKPVFSVFPKFYQDLELPELFETMKACGFDTVNAVIRDGFWIEPGNLNRDLGRYFQAAERADLKIAFATAGYSADEIIAGSDMLGILADHGICEFRMGYFRITDAFSVQDLLQQARDQMARVAEICETRKVKAVYQVHHGTLIQSATAVWHMVDGLDPEHVGVMLDPGNMAVEGRENWCYAMALLRPYLCALGVKDVVHLRDETNVSNESKGWSHRFVPVTQGELNWFDIFRALMSVSFSGTLVFMPFYHTDDTSKMTKLLGEEVTYLRGVVEALAAERNDNR